MEDVAPKLLEQIKDLYFSESTKNELLAVIQTKIKDKQATYIDAEQYANELGGILAKAYKETFVNLPDGKMYYNIAKRTVEPTMTNLQSDIADVTDEVQTILNEQAGLGINPIRPELEQDKIDGIVNRLANAESYDDISWILAEPIKTFARSVVDDAVKTNAEFHAKAGMSPKIVRKMAGNCCDWCKAVAGTYIYPDVPHDVYRRHQRCRCTVDYVVGKRKQNVWTKAWSDEVEPEKIEQRKTVKYGEDIAKMEESSTIELRKNYDSDLAKKFGNDYYDALHQKVIDCPDENLKRVWKKYEAGIAVGDPNYKGHEHCMGKTIYVNGTRDAKGNSWQSPYQVTFHESGHAIDFLARDMAKGSKVVGNKYSSLYKDGLFPKTIKEEVDEWVSRVDKQLKAEFKEHKDDIQWFVDNGYIPRWEYELNKSYYEQIGVKYRKAYAYSAIQKEIKALPTLSKADLSDILEGATGAKIQCGFGHGAKYWKDRTVGGVQSGLATEAFAEMVDSTMTCPESLETIKKYLPKSYAVFSEMLAELLK